MPIYSYICNKCGCKFEKLRGMTSKEEMLLCPNCGSQDLRKGINTFQIRGPKTSSSCSTCTGGNCSTCR